MALDALRDCQDFTTIACILLKASDSTAKAFEIAMENKTSYYDPLFRAVAEARRVPLLALDRKTIRESESKNECSYVPGSP